MICAVQTGKNVEIAWIGMPGKNLSLAAAFGFPDAAALLFSYTRGMSWAMRRRLIIFGIIAVVLAATLTIFYFTNYHVGPSCFDNKQNQSEEGIDCGGTCTYLCSASEQQPSVRFVRPVSPVPGRTDVIAYIDNPNANAAAKGLSFTIELYSPTNTVIAKKQGSVDLPPASTVPIFAPDFFSGSETAARAFITFDTPQHLWYRYRETRILPQVADIQITQSGGMPRVTATALNPSTQKLSNIYFVATVFDAAGNAIAASRTVAPTIPAQGTAPLVFTWPTAFSFPVARVEVVPVLPLPAQAGLPTP
ncbi:MAG: hypothetical protein JWO84_198 [Parcubacteria group bacterium]|nr:hypothetical protein [Parcubacteria group bacterium]